MAHSSTDMTEHDESPGGQHLVVADSAYGHRFWEAFCRYGQSTRDLGYQVLCFRGEQKKLYANVRVFKKTHDASGILAAYGSHPDDQADLQKFASAFERQSRTLISEILQADRHLGRGYSYSGQRHPLSPLGAKANYWDSVALIKQLHEYYREMLERESIGTILIGGIASLPIKLLCVAAHMIGVEVRIIASARVGNRFIWAGNEFFSIPQVTEGWRTTPSAAEPRQHDANIPKPSQLGVYAEAANYQSWFSRRFTLAGLIAESLRDIKGDMLSVVRRSFGGSPPKAGRYFLSARLRNHLNVYNDYRAFRRSSNRDWAGPPTVPFIFLPLHVEPEASLTVFSPEFNSQTAMIDLVAKALPAGITLVVKEHRAAIGRRPLGYYDWLKSIPAVVLAPLEANGSDLARRSRVTVTITGTAGFEAAVAGVPVITFGEHNFYNSMDHVHVVRDLGKLRELLREVTDPNQDREEFKANGQRFFDTLLGQSIDLADEVISPKSTPSEEAVEKLFNGFWATLKVQDLS